jgi:transcriptional regulator with XRE-family HTH domain
MPLSDWNVIAANIQRERREHGWTQAHLASVAGLTERTVQRAERAEPMSADTLQAIAAAFDVQLSALREPPQLRSLLDALSHWINQERKRVPLEPIEQGSLFRQESIAFSRRAPKTVRYGRHSCRTSWSVGKPNRNASLLSDAADYVHSTCECHQ